MQRAVWGSMLVEETFTLGPYALCLQRPADPEALLDEEAFEREEFLPYWAEPWPSGRLLAETLAYTDLSGLRVLELGCGLGLPSLVASLRGAQVTATDWAPDALALLRSNAARAGADPAIRRYSWNDDPAPLDPPFDLVLAADVLYERRDHARLLAVLPRLGGEVWLTDPGRPGAPDFLAAARERGWQALDPVATAPPRLTVHRLLRPAG